MTLFYTFLSLHNGCSVLLRSPRLRALCCPLLCVLTSSSWAFSQVLAPLFIFQDRVLVSIPGCPRIPSVDFAGFRLRDLPAFSSWVPGLKVCITTVPSSLAHSWLFLWTLPHTVTDSTSVLLLCCHYLTNLQQLSSPQDPLLFLLSASPTHPSPLSRTVFLSLPLSLWPLISSHPTALRKC